jgi:hypothetical protein
LRHRDHRLRDRIARLGGGAAIGALPRPDSFENTPRATPMRMVSMTAEPANPPLPRSA